MPYITARGLKGLKQYQYKPGGYTWLDDVHQPFWNGITELMPMWVAPNLITLVGTIGLLAAYVLYLFYLPALEGDAPRWVYFAGGTAVLAYLHLDCIDGKQARRTKSSSPLGQLFDHGCDALSVHLIVTNCSAALGNGLTWRSVLFAASVMGPWALAHWEEYHSGIMLYGTGYWGVTEANYLVVLGFYIGGVFGSGSWETPVLSRLVVFGRQITRGDLVMVLVVYGGIHQALGCILRTLWNKKIKVPPKERGHKQLGRANAIWHLVQLQAFFVIGTLSTLEAPVNMWHARVLLANYGVAYTLEMSKLIVAHMSKEPFTLSVWPIGCLLLTLANSHLQLLPAYSLACFTNIIIVAGYLHYAVYVVDEICAYLGIKCLSIPPPAEQ